MKVQEIDFKVRATHSTWMVDINKKITHSAWHPQIKVGGKWCYIPDETTKSKLVECESEKAAHLRAERERDKAWKEQEDEAVCQPSSA